MWARSRCIRFRLPRLDEQGFDSLDYSTQYEFAKRLKKVVRRGFDLKRTLIVDDTPEKVSQNYGNAIYIKPFLGALAVRAGLLAIEHQIAGKREQLRAVGGAGGGQPAGASGIGAVAAGGVSLGGIDAHAAGGIDHGPWLVVAQGPREGYGVGNIEVGVREGHGEQPTNVGHALAGLAQPAGGPGNENRLRFHRMDKSDW